MFRRRNIILNSILVVVLGAIGFFGWKTLYPAAAATTVRTATVSIQNVSTSVSATGAVQTSADIGLNFGTSGIVRSLNVKVGDQVKKGELLATTDSRASALAALQAQASEKSAEVGVANAQAGVTNATVALQNAQLAVTQGQQNSQTTLANDDQAIVSAQNALAKLQAGPTDATIAQQQQALVVSQQAINSADAALTNAQNSYLQVQQTNAVNLTGYNTSVDRTYADYSAKCTALSLGLGDCAVSTISSVQTVYRAWQDAIQAKASGTLRDSQSLTNAQTAIDNANRGSLSARQSYDSLKAQQAVANQPASQIDIDSANAAIATAQRAKANAIVLAAQQAQQAAGSVTTSQDSLVTAKGSMTNAQESLVLAKATLSNAETNLANTRLVSPVSATVAAIANDVGVNAGTTTAGSSGATGYIVLTELSGLQVKASFAEADVVSLQVGQAATFTFDAIPNATAQGTVLSIAPLSNASSGSVTTYNVTFSLDSAPAEVKPGMTAQVSVVTAQAQGVLAVTSTALTQRGNTYYVTMKPAKIGIAGVRKVVTVGLKGDSSTQILSGLKAGDQVVLRTTTSSSSSANNGFPGGGVPGVGGGVGAVVRANG